MTNIALGFASAIFATRLSPRAVYFIQTGSSALSNTYNTYKKYTLVKSYSIMCFLWNCLLQIDYKRHAYNQHLLITDYNRCACRTVMSVG